MARVSKIIGGLLLLLVVAVGLAVTIVPRFLDRIYYRGHASDHYDGERFFNPDNDGDTAGVPGGGGRAGFLWRQLTGRDGRPVWPVRVPVAAAKPAARVEGERMVVTWIGHASVLIQTQDLNILTDPVYAERAGPLGFGPARVAAPGVAFDDLPRIDLVLVSHNHYDHLDLATLKRLWQRDHPHIVTSLGNDSVIAATGAKAMALDWGGNATLTDTGLENTSDAMRCDPDGACPDDRARIFITRNHHWGSRWFMIGKVLLEVVSF